MLFQANQSPIKRSLDWLSTRSGITWLVVLGAALRSYHYLRGPSLWHDEAALVVNVLEKSFRELLGPLLFSEAAPPLFLWLEKAVVMLLGDSLYALRLPPFLASCASLGLLAYVARRWLSPAAAPWAVLLFACSDKLLGHSCEAKQYTIEALAALVVLALYIRTENWLLERRLLLFAALAPVLMSLAYPGCFLYGGLLLAFLPSVWRSRHASEWLSYAALATCVFSTFALLLIGPMYAQRNQAIVECWEGMRQFPDWNRPWTVPGWLLRASMELIAYVIRPIGPFFVPGTIIGAVVFWRRGMFAPLTLLATPILLAGAASCFKAYPYGGVRVMVYAAPAIVLWAGAGIELCLAWFGARQRALAWALAAVLLAPLGFAARQVAFPSPRADCASAAAFVEQHRQADEPVAANHWEYLYYFRNLGLSFSPLERFTPPTQGRVWFVATAAERADRDACLTATFPVNRWQTIDRKEFERTSVVLVQAKRDATAGLSTGLSR
ncbi:MAG TPA: glycosyltransferase family 39 protein [Pirellulales bacterium]|nr:glycosyltransferase family 39 protein [Pirellulales bacterium]